MYNLTWKFWYHHMVPAKSTLATINKSAFTLTANTMYLPFRIKRLPTNVPIVYKPALLSQSIDWFLFGGITGC